jgi:glycosyltransferase involved in cell wall biosynthesis
MSCPGVIIFRHELFKRSEPFIVRQAQAVPGFRPIYVGRTRLGAAPEETTHYALWQDHEKGMPYRIWQSITRSPRGYLDCLRNGGGRIVHAHFGVEGVYAMPLAKRLKIPLVTTFHGFDATLSARYLIGSRKPSWINYAVHRGKLSREGQLFLCVSKFIRRRVLELGFPENRTLVHYVGIDTKAIVPQLNRSTSPVILHVGRMVEKKGAADLLRAFAMLPRRHRDARLQIVGEGPLRAALVRMSRDLGIAERVDFMGALAVEVVLSLMGKATVLCQPSMMARSGDTEGLPIALLEAAASGLPVVSTRHAGIPELVDDGRTGVLVDERDHRQLAAALDELLTDAELRGRMAIAARKRVEAEFDLSRQSALLAGLYRGLL